MELILSPITSLQPGLTFPHHLHFKKAVYGLKRMSHYHRQEMPSIIKSFPDNCNTKDG
jgi:hypothetical protein